METFKLCVKLASYLPTKEARAKAVAEFLENRIAHKKEIDNLSPTPRV